MPLPFSWTSSITEFACSVDLLKIVSKTFTTNSCGVESSFNNTTLYLDGVFNLVISATLLDDA
jgi:hypothetical protein